MEVHEATFDPRDVERCCMGAGVIPMSVCPRTRVPHLLLGRERWLPTWKGSCRWSGFEGSRKECESACMTAAREFVEESLGCVGVGGDRDAVSDVIRALDAGAFWKRIVLRIENDRRPERYHATYLVPMAWDADVARRFQEARASIEQIDRLAQEWTHTRPACVGDHGEDVGELTVQDDGALRVEKLLDTSPCIVRMPWRRNAAGDALAATFADNSAEARQVRRWFELRERLQRAVTSFQHPCVRVRRDERWRLVQDVSINRDHLEKDQVRWWSVDELAAVIDGRGQLGTDRFRPYFLPVLQTALTLVTARTREVGWEQEREREQEREQSEEVVCAPCESEQSASEGPEARRGSPTPTAPIP